MYRVKEKLEGIKNNYFKIFSFDWANQCIVWKGWEHYKSFDDKSLDIVRYYNVEETQKDILSFETTYTHINVKLRKKDILHITPDRIMEGKITAATFLKILAKIKSFETRCYKSNKNCTHPIIFEDYFKILAKYKSFWKNPDICENCLHFVNYFSELIYIINKQLYQTPERLQNKFLKI